MSRSEKEKQPWFLADKEAWELRFSSKFRIELVHRMNDLLEKSGMTQAEVAEIAGWKASYLSRMLHGEQNLTLKSIARFEEAIQEDVLMVSTIGDSTTGALKRTKTMGVLPDTRKVDMKAIYRGVEKEREKHSEAPKILFRRTATNEEELADVG